MQIEPKEKASSCSRSNRSVNSGLRNRILGPKVLLKFRCDLAWHFREGLPFSDLEILGPNNNVNSIWI